MPLGRYHQTLASWPGDIALLPHLKNFVLQGAFDVDVSFGECIEITAQTHRKDLAARTYNEVKDHFARMRRQNHKS
jgi:1-acyl-sn-glycerol-3-phosphate acyltransferase